MWSAGDALQEDEILKLFEMQLNQRKHDENYHRDIFFLNYQDRLKHVAFHYAKYSGRLARDIRHRFNSKEPSSGHDVGKTLTDAFIMTLSGAELFNVNLESVVRSSLGLPLEEDSFDRFVSLVSTKSSLITPIGTRSSDQVLLSFLLELDDCSGIISKTCDGLDHMEGIDRKLVINTLGRILILLIVAGDAFQVNYELSVPSRLKDIEQNRLL